MKKALTIFSFMLCLILIFGTCKCQVYSQYGHNLPLHTNGNSVRIMLVFVEFTGIGAPNPITPNWPAGQLPLDKDDYIDHSFTNNPQNYISKLMWESSFGQFKVEGDYVNSLIQIDVSNMSNGPDLIAVKLALDNMANNSTLTFSNYNNISEFDHYTIAGQGHYYSKPAAVNNRIDGLIICYRNNATKPCSGGHGCVEYAWPPGTIGTYGVDVGCDFGMCGGVGGMEFIIEEFFHSMYGDNNWHAGSGGGRHTFPFQTNPWGLATQSAGAGITNIACGWDRDFCEWKGWSDLNKTIIKANTIMAKGGTNVDIATDFDNLTLFPNAQDFILRDYVTYGDAIRIKLPHINCDALGKPKNQYLWIENHQLISMFDHGQWEYNSCKDPITKGMYCQLQVGKDIKDNTTSPFIIEAGTQWEQPNASASWLFPLTAEGNYDFAYGTSFAPNVGCVWGNKTTPIDFYSPNTKPNPFTGFSDLYGRINNNGNNLVDVLYGGDEYPPWHCDIDANSNLNYNSHFKGDGKDAFSFANGSTKLSICTNPSTAPVYTLLSRDGWGQLPDPIQINMNYENRIIWLNGISVEILQENFSPITFGQGAIKVRVKFNDYDVDRNVRWCGEIKLSPNDFNISNPSLVIKSAKEIQLDRGESPTQVYAVNTSPPYQFTKPTYFTCLPNSIIVMESNSKIIVDNGSTLHLNSNSKIEMSSGAQIIVKNNSKLILDPTSWIKVNNGASIYIETGSTIVYDQAVVQLVGVNSVLDIAGTLDIKANSNFQCMGMVQGLLCNGFVRLSYPTTISSNVIAGNNCTMNFINTTVGKKALEVTQECFFVPSNLVSITMQGCHAAMGVGSRISVPGANTIVNINNARMKSLNNIPKSQGGLWLYGQANINISNSQFDDGNYGIYDFQTMNGHSLTLQSCSFKNNNIGLYTWGEGAMLNDCNFYLNNVGWQGKLMSLPCISNGGIVGGSLLNTNVLGYDFYSQGTATLQINDPQITYNTDGIIVEGTTAIVTCGTISNNSSSGISIVNNGNIDMHGNGAVHAQVTAVDNGFTISCDKGRGILLQNGYNDLRPLNSNTQSVINGVLRRKCPPANIIASNNHWDIGGNVLSSNDYNLVTAINNQGCLAATPITVVDNFPVSPALCGQAIPPCPFPPCNDLDALQACSTCEHIDTQTFEWERLNTAAQDALHLTTAAGGYDYLGAISLLNELLMYDESSINNKEQYVIDYSYDKIKEALGNAFKKDLIPVANNTSTVNMSVAKVIEVEDKFIANAIINDDYYERFFVSLDKVQTYRIAGNLDMALTLLGDMSNWAETDEQSIVNSWICFLTIELGIFNNTILIEDIEPSIYACSGSNPNRIIQQMSNEILHGYATVNNISLLPNHTKTGFNILSADGASEYEIEIFNVVGVSVQQNSIIKGKYIDCSKLSAGVYHVKLKNTINNFVSVEKLVVE